MNTREYLPPDAPLIRDLGFSDHIGGSSGGMKFFENDRQASLGRSSTQSAVTSHSYTRPPLFSQIPLSYQSQAAPNPYLPSSQGLSRYLAAPSVHLTPAGLWLSKSETNADLRDEPTAPTDTRLPSGSLKPRIVNKEGQRLPTVLKKALPLPPEDIRSVPHVRVTSPRPETPPVVSIGMSDISGLPVPWSKTPELIVAAQSGTQNDLKNNSSSLADYIRERMRLDFDNLEIFIEEAFTR